MKIKSNACQSMTVLFCAISIINCYIVYLLFFFSALTETSEMNTHQINAKFTRHCGMSSAGMNVFSFFIAVDFVSAPFCVSKSHIYEGIGNPDTFFRPALRSLLVSNALMYCSIKWLAS